MSDLASQAHVTHCPTCGSRKVLVVAVTATVASLYCLSCEHLFAAEIAPGLQDPASDEQPLTPPPPACAETTFRYTPGS